MKTEKNNKQRLTEISERGKKARMELPDIGVGAAGSVIGGGTAVLDGRCRYGAGVTFRKKRADQIDTDPLGSWTGVPTDDPYEKPIQDADDL